MSVKSKKSVSPSMSVLAEKRPSGRRTYTSQYKREAVELVEREGVSVAEAARRLGVDQTLLRSWKIKFQQQGTRHFPALASGPPWKKRTASCARRMRG
jgi:transposase